MEPRNLFNYLVTYSTGVADLFVFSWAGNFAETSLCNFNINHPLDDRQCSVERNPLQISVKHSVINNRLQLVSQREVSIANGVITDTKQQVNKL